MISVNATVKGEPDASPLFVTYQYQSRSDEIVLSNSIAMVREKLGKGQRLNVYEAMTVYCAYTVSQIRDQTSDVDIERNAQRILSSENVMIGVAESLQEIKFEATVDNFPKRHLTLNAPIGTTRPINQV